MELRHLRYFVAVAEELNFTKAAEKLRIAQPSLSRQVRNLEEEIGVQLFDRTNSHVTLTPEGRLFFFDSRNLLAQTAANVAAVQHMSLSKEGRLNIGYIANSHNESFPATLSAFLKIWPDVALNLFNMNCGEQLEALASSKIDIGFVGLRPPISPKSFLAEFVTKDSMWVALSANHQLARHQKLRLADLSKQFFIGMSERTHPGARDWLVETCRSAGFTAQILQEAEREFEILRFVSNGLGVALVPGPVRSILTTDIVFRPITPTLHRESTILWRADDTSKPLHDYIRIITEFSQTEGRA